MENRIVREKNLLVIQVPKEVDHCFTENLRDQVDLLCIQTESIQKLVFDFTETEFMDSSGIGMLMGRYKLMQALGGTVCAVHVGDRIYKILKLCGVTKIIRVEKEQPNEA